MGHKTVTIDKDLPYVINVAGLDIAGIHNVLKGSITKTGIVSTGKGVGHIFVRIPLV